MRWGAVSITRYLQSLPGKDHCTVWQNLFSLCGHASNFNSFDMSSYDIFSYKEVKYLIVDEGLFWSTFVVLI